MKRILGTLFDLDGTLIDSEHALKYGSWRNVLRNDFNCRFPLRAYSGCAGYSGVEIAQQLIVKYNLPITPQELRDRKQEELHKLLRTQIIPTMAYAEQAIRRFRRGPFAIVTSDGEEETEIKLHRSGLAPLLAGIPKITPAGSARSKPFPDLYIAGLDAIGIKPANVLAFEDTQAGVTSASRAGVMPIGIADRRFAAVAHFASAAHTYRTLQSAVRGVDKLYNFQY